VTIGLVATLVAERGLRGRDRSGAVWPWMLGAGALLGLAALTRPVMVYFVVLAVPVLALARRDRVALVAAAAFAVGALVPALAWTARNEHQTGRWIFSSAQGQNLFDYGAVAKAIDEGRIDVRLDTSQGWNRDVARAGDRLAAEHPGEFGGRDVAARDAAWGRVGWRALWDHPGGAAMVGLLGLTRVTVGPGHTLLQQLAGAETGAGAVVVEAYAVITLVAELALGLAGFVILCRRRAGRALGLLAVPAGYYLLLSAGPEMYARFRVPVVPALGVMVGVAVAALLDRRRGGAPAHPVL
jgi:4-amino-4-deoxy-L-arabinose transferase-like glycosyltransferase